MARFLGVIPMRGIAKITNSRMFKKKALKAFHECDKDQSGRLDEKELHICLLILYDKLNEKLPCHIRTPKPSDVHELYERHTGGQGSLSEQQFLEVAAELFASAEHWYDSVPVKVALTVGLQLALFPLIGKGLGWASKESGVPVIKSVSPALWAHAIEKVYKIVRVSLPELP